MIGDLLRLGRIAATFRRTGALAKTLEAVGVSGWRRDAALLITAPLGPFGKSGERGLPPVARALSALGPSYVKFGQVLSTRSDIAGAEMVKDLRFLQDKLPPFSDQAARRMVAEQLGAPVETLFQRFDPPIAAASIAQVHPALLPDGRKVAVKVLRPNIERAFARDISAFYLVAKLVPRVLPRIRRLRPTEVVRHFEGVVTREMDLRLEAAAGSEYRDNTAQEIGFRTPRIIWEHTARRVLTTEWVEGVSMGDLDALRAQGADLSALALRLMRLFLRTALRDGYFHADMHHGNLKLAPDGGIVAFDFGIMGRIDARTRRTYAEILYSYLTRDYRRGAQAHFDAGYVSRSHDIDAFAQALRSIGEPIVDQHASEISMARLLQQLFDVTEQFGMETRPELILLQRTMVVVEGVARSLDPSFNMWEAARPEVERWMRENIGPQGLLRELKTSAEALARLGPRLPEIAERIVVAAERWAQQEEEAHARNGAAAPPPAPPSRRGFWRGAALGLLLGAAALAAGAELGAWTGYQPLLSAPAAP